MKLSSKNIRGPDRRVLILVGAVALVIFAACVLAYVVIQVAPLSSLAGLLTGTGAPTQVAQSGTSATPAQPTPTVPVAAPTASSTPTPTASPTKTLTPSPTPTLTRTPTATNIPTMTPTPDPWIVVRDERVGCSSEFTFEPVQAIQVKFQMLSGGGADRSISFSCCGSAGADAFVADHWVPVTLPLPSLKVGQTLETKQFERGVFDRARFYVGCNDGEQMQVRISYLPAPTSVVTPTATLTVTATGTIAPTAAVSVTVTPTATVAITPTSGITSTSGVSATVTPTATAAITPTSGITSTSGVSATVTPTATADITSTSGVTPTTTVTTTLAITATRPATPTGGIAFHRNDAGIDRAYIYNLDGGTVTPLVDVGPVMDLALSTSAPFGAWSPDNDRFVYVSTVSPGGSNILRVIDFKDGSNRALYSSDTGGGLSSPTWSPDGKQIAFIRLAGNQHLWAIDVVNADGTRCGVQYECEVTANHAGEQFRGGLDWSKKNGLFTLAINSTGANEVYTMFSDGNGRTRLTDSPADDSTPAWSPNGKRIAFTSDRGGRPQIYVMNADGSSVRRVSRGDVSDVSPTWSPDGNWIAFTSARGGSTDIYMMDVDGGNVTRLTKTGGDHPLWSR